MRYQSNHAEVVAEGFGQSAIFSIAGSGKAFKGLLDGAYSRKIEAAIRESATNALDSHRAAGVIVPFDVHLPTVVKPTYSIRDYGTGMSHEFMMTRFTVMFDSTKDGLNAADASLITPDDQVGMLGIGRMAFFAYTDHCTITVWQNGEKRFYALYLGPDEIPRCDHAGTEASDEPDGVKIEFAVRSKDFAEFERVATRVFKGFPVMPNGLKTKVQQALRVEPREIGKFWRSFPKDYLPESVFWAKQGCVLYPVDLKEIDDRVVETTTRVYDEEEGWQSRKGKKLSERYQDFANSNVCFIIDFPIGTIDFDLGRERLAYNDRTIISLRDRWDEMLADFGSKLDAIFDGTTSNWEYMLRGGRGSLSEMGTMFKRTPQYERALNQLGFLRSLMAPKRSERSSLYPLHAVYRFNHDKKKGVEVFQTLHSSDAPGMFSKDKIPDDFEKSVVLIRDKKIQRLGARLERYMADNDLKWAFVFNEDEFTPKLRKGLGKPKTMNFTDLPELPKAERVKGAYHGGGGSFDRMKIISTTSKHHSTATDPSQLDGAVFGFINCGEIHNPDPAKYPDLDIDDVYRMNHLLHFFTGRTIALVNIKSNEFDKIEEKWGDLPLFYGCTDDIIDHIKVRDLKDFMAIINADRFEHSIYEDALNRWEKVFPREKTPLNKLSRFEERVKKLDAGRKAMLIQFLNDGNWTRNDESPFVKAVLAKAARKGIEILPRVRSNTGGPVPYPDLLPPVWHRMVDLLRSMNFHHRVESEIVQHRKTIYMAIRKELQC